MSSWLLAQTVIEQLIDCGCTDVVLSPGSRNAPLSMALDRAERAGRLRLHVRIDERSAGFLALGIARAQRRPVAVVTTSGTAVGNLVPAVMEANHSGIPLVVLSADRPGRMIGSGANQTTDQSGLFGSHVRNSIRMDSNDSDVAAWRSQLRRVLTAARGVRTRNPGPVQVNLAFDVPLMPTEEQLPACPDWQVDESLPTAPVRLPVGPRTVVLAGDATPEVGQRAREVAEQAWLPLLAEPSSNARAGKLALQHYRLLLEREELGGSIERVLVFGHPTLSRPVSTLLARQDVEVIAVAGGADWPDQGFSVQRVCDDVLVERGDLHWTNRWITGDQHLAVKIQMARASRGDDATLDGETLAALVVERCAGGNLVLGSSSPIRDADLAPIGDEWPARVDANRGLAGIDGTISTAIGIHLGLGEPVTALMGDLTFLHDIGGLWLGQLEARPQVRLVVSNDQGGAIFHGLEQGAPEHAESFERVFATPHRADLVGLAKAHGWAAHEVVDLEELGMWLRMPVRGPEVLVVAMQRNWRRDWAAQLRSF